MFKSIARFFSPSKPDLAVEVPPELNSILISELRNPEAAQYTLQMVWLGRADKFSRDKAPAYDWISRTFLPEHLSSHYTGFSPRTVHFSDQNHHELAWQCIRSTIKACPNLQS